MTRALYELVPGAMGDGPMDPLVIRDLGGPVSVAEDAVAVVADLAARGMLLNWRRVYFYDETGNLREIRKPGEDHPKKKKPDITVPFHPCFHQWAFDPANPEGPLHCLRCGDPKAADEMLEGMG